MAEVQDDAVRVRNLIFSHHPLLQLRLQRQRRARAVTFLRALSRPSPFFLPCQIKVEKRKRTEENLSNYLESLAHTFWLSSRTCKPHYQILAFVVVGSKSDQQMCREYYYQYSATERNTVFENHSKGLILQHQPSCPPKSAMQNVQTLRPASYSHDEQRPHAKFQPPNFKTVDLYREAKNGLWRNIQLGVKMRHFC